MRLSTALCLFSIVALTACGSQKSTTYSTGNGTATVTKNGSTMTYESKEQLQETLRANKAEMVHVARGLSSAIPEVPTRDGAIVRIITCSDGIRLSWPIF